MWQGGVQEGQQTKRRSTYQYDNNPLNLAILTSTVSYLSENSSRKMQFSSSVILSLIGFFFFCWQKFGGSKVDFFGGLTGEGGVLFGKEPRLAKTANSVRVTTLDNTAFENLVTNTSNRLVKIAS
ncbi:hypothetical protein FOCG_05566, partial [Fusarium oxysporum f. sp. radicis-lycopersici 26381]